MSLRSHVLLADDDDATRRFLARELSTDCEVTTACDGIEALEACAQRRFDLVVTDHTMPGMDGLTLLGRLRQRADYATVPLIFLTATADPAVTVAAVKRGACRIFHKPVSLADFHADVLHLLQQGDAAPRRGTLASSTVLIVTLARGPQRLRGAIAGAPSHFEDDDDDDSPLDRLADGKVVESHRTRGPTLRARGLRAAWGGPSSRANPQRAVVRAPTPWNVVC